MNFTVQVNVGNIANGMLGTILAMALYTLMIHSIARFNPELGNTTLIMRANPYFTFQYTCLFQIKWYSVGNDAVHVKWWRSQPLSCRFDLTAHTAPTKVGGCWCRVEVDITSAFKFSCPCLEGDFPQGDPYVVETPTTTWRKPNWPN